MLQSQNRANPAKAAAVAKTDPKIIDPKLLQTKPAPDYKVELSKPASAPTVSLPSVPTPSIPTPDLPKLPETKPDKPEFKKPDIKKTPDIDLPVKEYSLKKPAIIFIKGLDLFSSPSTSERGYAGVGKIADAVEGS